jgi:hypothetical protein
MKNRDVETLPGGITYVDAASNANGIKTAFEVNLDLNHLLMDIQDVRERIRGSFYADLFLMLANATDTRMTATEVAERHEEKLLMLGPVIERLHNELLDPMIDLTFQRMIEANILPPIPNELQGMEFDADQWADSYSDMLGVDPKLIVAGEQVAMIREARNKAQAAQAQMAAMQQQAETAKTMAQAPTGGSENALTDVMNMFSGYNSPSATEIGR